MTENEAIKHCYEVAGKQCKNKCGKDHIQLAKWIEELLEYRKLGTVEEVREAVEKTNAIKAIETKGRYPYTCPKCKRELEIGYKHCIHCGQLLKYTE